MSRSNPQEHAQNPATRWFEWNGEKGLVRYYDKTAKQNVDVGSDFTFLLLDQLGSVRGWHDASESGIYSNEVKDTRQDALIVKAFKGGTLAEGIYKDIKDRVNALGGQFVANCYIGFKNGSDTLALGSIRFKGAALSAWMDFCKANRSDIYEKAIRINGFTEGKKGRITFRVPVLKTLDVSDATNTQAVALDRQLQEYLTGYLQRNKHDQVAQPPHDVEETYNTDESPVEDYGQGPPLTDDDIPF